MAPPPGAGSAGSRPAELAVSRPLKGQVPAVTVPRLALYLRKLRELRARGVERISSQELAELIDLNAAQIRKDFSYFGEFGVRGVGYEVTRLIEEIGRCLSIHPEVYRSIVLNGRPDRVAHLEPVAWIDDNHVWHRPHHGDVLDWLMRLAGFPGQKPRETSDNLDRQPRLRDENPDLVETALSRKDRECRREGHITNCGKAGGDSKHVLLGNAHWQIPFWMNLLEQVKTGGAPDVCI